MSTTESSSRTGPEPGDAPDDGPPGTGGATAADDRSPARTWGFRALGLALGGLTWLLLGTAETLEPDARTVAAIGVLMATWWVTEAIPLSATALLPIVAFPALGVLSVGEATESYADPIVFLFMGGDGQQVPAPAVPGVGPRDQPDPALQHQQGGLAGVLVLGELPPAEQGDSGLLHRVLVPAHHRVGGPACGAPPGRVELFAGDGVEGELVHGDLSRGGAG